MSQVRFGLGEDGCRPAISAVTVVLWKLGSGADPATDAETPMEDRAAASEFSRSGGEARPDCRAPNTGPMSGIAMRLRRQTGELPGGRRGHERRSTEVWDRTIRRGAAPDRAAERSVVCRGLYREERDLAEAGRESAYAAAMKCDSRAVLQVSPVLQSARFAG